MNDSVVFRPNTLKYDVTQNAISNENGTQIQPNINELQDGLYRASALIDNVVLKKYLYHLNEIDILPLPDEFKNIGAIRLFKITEMVYQKDEYSTYKFASVFSSLQNLNCGIFVLIDSDGKKQIFIWESDPWIIAGLQNH